jgi:hypothetical protein
MVARQKGSKSQVKTGCIPAFSKPKSSPRHPLKNESAIMSFILTAVNNYDEYGLAISALKEFEERIALNRWFIYEGTRNRKALKEGDKILFYLSGKKLIPQIAAKAEISKIRKPLSSETNANLQSPVHSVLEFKNFERFDAPIDFKKILQYLSFAPSNMQKWGVVVFGGCRRISEQDYETILSGLHKQA